MATSPTVGRVTSWYGKRKAPLPGASTYHRGVDIGAPAGTPVVAPLAGTITIAATSTVRGNYVVIRHDARWSTLHQHLGTIGVRPGQTVAEGQAVGTVGATGVATAAHLHTEVHDYGTPIDPRPWYAARGVPTLGARSQVAGVHVEASMSAADVAAIRADIAKLKTTVDDLLTQRARYQLRNPLTGAITPTLDALKSMWDYSIRAYLEANAAKKAAAGQSVDVAEVAAALAPILVDAVAAAAAQHVSLTPEQVRDATERAMRDVLGSLG